MQINSSDVARVYYENDGNIRDFKAALTDTQHASCLTGFTLKTCAISFRHIGHVPRRLPCFLCIS